MAENDSSNHTFGSQSSIGDDWLDELIAALCLKFNWCTEPDFLKERLRVVFERFERGRLNQPLPRTEYRRHLTALDKATERFLRAVDTMPEVVLDAIEDAVNRDDESRWQNWSFQSGAPIPEDAQKLRDARSAAATIHTTVKLELAQLDQSSGQRSPPKNAALDQLLVDLEGVYESYIQESAKSGCYYVPARDGYGGPFFDFVKLVLDAYGPNLYFSDGALGKRIERSLGQE